jgi:CobQ/CobB/MinD/ParA nucleotide binding domain
MLRITGFYSFKGGVGRSMALAHCAVEWAKRGRKVLIVDLDLEAPGQHCTNLFFQAFEGLQSAPRPGFINFCEDFKQSATHGLPDLERYVLRTSQELRATPDSPPVRGELFLMPAGDLRPGGSYQKDFATFNWADALGPNFETLAHLKTECNRLGFDEILIDSRTGDADPFYVVSLELAHVLVMVSGYNRQNLLGTQSQMALLDRYPPSRLPNKRLMVLSPKPLGFDGLDEGYWRSHILPLVPDLPEPATELPYDKRLALSEDMLIEDMLHGKEGYARNIGKLIHAIESPQPAQTISATTTLINPFSVIRTDYASNSELTRFFVDPGEAVTRALRDFMPVMVSGNRGTGKTMLAKHFAYETRKEALGREATAQDLPQQVGLYLRFDIDLLNIFNTRDDGLRPQFDLLYANFFDILVLKKALSALHAFGGLASWCEPSRLFRLLYREFEAKEGLTTPEHQTLEAFLDFVDEHFSRIRRYINNPSDVRPPFKVQSNILMKLLVEVLLSDPRQAFGGRWFAVLVDEVEHFQTYQQRVLNSRIKQIKFNDRTTYRYFLRHEGLRTQATVVSADKNEQQQIIQESHDYRTLKLDEGLTKQFEHHVSQVAARQLNLQPQLGRVLLAEEQRDLSQLLESWTPEQEAQQLMARSKRVDKVKQWLQKQKFSLSPRFWGWYEQQDDAVLRRVVAVFLIQQGNDADAVAQAFGDWTDQARNWYHNYHRAALFWLCRQYSANKLYGGLNDVLLLSGQNVRYFLEYLRAIVDHWLTNAAENTRLNLQLPIPIEVQDKAIRARAQFYIDDLRGKPRYAEEMLNLVNRLGAVFAEMHGSPRQSQFEVNHFSIADLGPDAAKELKDWLRECRMENVLLRRPGNKQKSVRDDRLDDWVLHPCFAPHFNISLRRKKKLDGLSKTDLQLLFKGQESEFKALAARLSKVNKASSNAAEINDLFDEAVDDDAEFAANALSIKKLARHLDSVDVLLRGHELNAQGRHVPTEEREHVLQDAAKIANVPIWRIRIASDEEVTDSAAKDRFAIKRPGEALETPFWHELADWLRQHCSEKHLMLDLTTLSGSCLFQLHRAALHAGCTKLSYAYTTPVRYPQVDTPDTVPPVVTRAIKQPYGYRSFAQEHLRSGKRRHLIVLGFDRHRPNKFIEHYQWPLEDVHLLLGNPAYVDGGVEQAQKSMGTVYRELDKLGHVHIINPKLLFNTSEGSGVVNTLEQLSADVQSVDIVPLGPKPTLLGVMVYWHMLPEQQQALTRILYDFPITRQQRTRGTHLTWVYDSVLTPMKPSA